jgi:2-haloacid dehalogenase
MNRRHFLNAAALSAAAGLARGAAAPAESRRVIKAVAFDGFAIFDPRPIGALAEELFPGNGAALMLSWRTRQFEYSWLRTLTGSYVNFWHVTVDALRFACAALEIDLTPEKQERLMDAHLALKAWPDVLPALQSLRAAGVRLALLTNFTAAMQTANLRSAGLDDFFEARLSTDAVKAYKPDPRSYQMGVDHFELPRGAIAFAAFGGWDAVGAKRFGFPVYWCNRLVQPDEELGVAADRVAPTLAALPAFVGAGQS